MKKVTKLVANTHTTRLVLPLSWRQDLFWCREGGAMMAESGENKDGFQGKIGQNVQKSRTEIEENILRMLYDWWVQGRQLTRDMVCEKMGMTRRKLAYYITSMTEHGYLEKTGEKETLFLTDFGKEQGADCHCRHQSITHFIQMTCGLDEKSAAENACRMEHVISGDVIEGMYHFLRTGELYDSVVRNMDFHTRYAVGEYAFCMAIYQLDRRYPRVLAEEYSDFDESIIVEVGEKESYIYLRPVREERQTFLWYKREDLWRRAEKTEKGYRIPAEIFAVTSNGKIPVTEGEGMIAFTEDNTLPREEDCRELDIYLW